jgi:hypothetical protein
MPPAMEELGFVVEKYSDEIGEKIFEGDLLHQEMV